MKPPLEEQPHVLNGPVVTHEDRAPSFGRSADPRSFSEGDDNLCNIPHALPCSPAKRSKENQGRRLLFGDPSESPEKPSSPGLSPRRGEQETPRHSGLGRHRARTQLFKQEGERGWGGGQGMGVLAVPLSPPDPCLSLVQAPATSR